MPEVENEILHWDFLHGDRAVFAILRNVAVLSLGLGALHGVVAHLGVFVVDGVDADEEDWDDHHHECNKTCDQGQVILCVQEHQ